MTAGWSQAHYIVKDDLKHRIHLTLPLECWDYKSMVLGIEPRGHVFEASLNYIYQLHLQAYLHSLKYIEHKIPVLK